MTFFLFAAVLLLAAGLLWFNQAVGKNDVKPLKGEKAAPPTGICPETLEALAGAAAALRELMKHPLAGGPGFISLRLALHEDAVCVTAQYPNIRETLYRRVVRRELDGDVLMQEGVPERLMEMSPDFETESGGIVAVTVEVRGRDCEIVGAMANLRERQAALGMMEAYLQERFPDMSVRCIGGELLLTEST